MIGTRIAPRPPRSTWRAGLNQTVHFVAARFFQIVDNGRSSELDYPASVGHRLTR